MHDQRRRPRLGLKQELLLALAPTVTVLLVLWLVEALSTQRLLFASLASSAFLIYLDPAEPINSTRTLLLSQVSAAVIGVAMLVLLGPGYASAGAAMVLVVIVMVSTDSVHPPAIATALSFGLKAQGPDNLGLFLLALLITVALLVLQRLTLWLVRRLQP